MTRDTRDEQLALEILRERLWALADYVGATDPDEEAIDGITRCWDAAVERAEKAERALADPRWLESLALWLDEADRLLREAAKNGLLVNRRDGRDMTPEEVQSRIIAHSDNGAQQELRAIAERTREALVHVKGGEDV